MTETKKCQDCGYEAIDSGSESGACPGCGRVAFGKLVLAGSAGSIETKIDLQAGRGLLRRAIGEDAQYAAEDQFRVRRDGARGGWVLEPVRGVVNETWLNGEPIPEGDPPTLKPGDTLSIKGKCGLLEVRLEK